jgi:hypothetical protein
VSVMKEGRRGRRCSGIKYFFGCPRLYQDTAPTGNL